MMISSKTWARGLLAESPVEDLLGLFFVPRQQPVIKDQLVLQRRLVVEQDGQGGESGDVFSQHGQADRQRRREHQADGAPEPGPEDRRDQHRHRRDPGLRSDDDRFDDVSDQHVEPQE